jgi:cytochrome P450
MRQIAEHRWPFPKQSPGLMARQALFGDVQPFELSCFKELGRFIVSLSAVLTRHVLSGRALSFEKETGIEQVKMLLGDGLITSEGEFWRDQQQHLQPAFKVKNLNLMYAVQTLSHAAGLGKYSMSRRDDGWFAIGRFGLDHFIVLRNALYFIFGNRMHTLDGANGDKQYDFVHKWRKRDLPFVKITRVKKPIIRAMITDIRNNALEPTSILKNLANSISNTSVKLMAKSANVDDVITLIISGHEATAASRSRSWMWVLLAENTEWLDMIDRETNAITPPRNDQVQAFFQQYPQSRAVVMETLTLCPLGWMHIRRALGTANIVGIELHKGDEIWLPVYWLNLNLQYWFEPEPFQPQCFLPAMTEQLNKAAYLPFSSGSRVCTGKEIALVALLFQLQWFFANYSLELLTQQSVDIDVSVNLRLAQPIWSTYQKKQGERS